MRKMGSIDMYILCTKPKDLDSKYGEYLRELMMRKINDPDYRVPYVLGSGKRSTDRYRKRDLDHAKAFRFKVPRNFKEKLITCQKPFGIEVDELNQEDYGKLLELKRMKK